MKQHLYIEQERLVIYDAAEIGSKGFGYERGLALVDGQYIVAEQERAFKLMCGHLVVEAWQLDGSCAACKSLAVEAGLPFPDCEWATQICTRCRLERCGGCLKRLCPGHRIPVPSGYLCAECLQAISLEMRNREAQIEFEESVARNGALVAYGQRLLASLFNTNGAR